MPIKPAALGLTKAEYDTYCAVKHLQESGQMVTSVAVARSREVSKVQACKTLRTLIEKGLVRKYGYRFYQLAGKE